MQKQCCGFRARTTLGAGIVFPVLQKTIPRLTEVKATTSKSRIKILNQASWTPEFKFCVSASVIFYRSREVKELAPEHTANWQRY